VVASLAISHTFPKVHPAAHTPRISLTLNHYSQRWFKLEAYTQRNSLTLNHYYTLQNNCLYSAG